MMSALSEKIWNGTLNVAVLLSPADSNQMTQTREFYVS